MIQITKYKAFDGSEFANRTKCLEYEHESYKALSVIKESNMPNRPNSCNYSNGHGYVQHDEDNFLRTRKNLLGLAKTYTDHKWIQESIDDITIHASWAHRIIGECANKSLNDAWYRILCTDGQYREWGQPYYADNPEKAENIRLN